jgi:hypothetical protein
LVFLVRSLSVQVHVGEVHHLNAFYMATILGRLDSSKRRHPWVRLIVHTPRMIDLSCTIRLRPGHSMPFDLKNEELVAMFKRMMGHRRPTDAVMKRISRNLVLLKKNMDSLKSASGIRGNRETEQELPLDEVRICADFFEENQILEDQGRILESFFKVDEQKLSEKDKKKLDKLHGNLEQRSLQDCLDTFLPKIIRSMQSVEQMIQDEGEDANGLLGDEIDLDNEEFDSGIDFGNEFDFRPE